MISDEIQAAERAAVVEEVLTWLQTPYHHHARIKGVGVDCAHLLCAVFEFAGLVPPVDPGTYAVDWHLHHSEEQFSGWMAKYARLIPPDHDLIKPGDVVLWKYGRCFSHGSIYVGDGLFVHSYLRLGVIESSATEEPLCGRESQHWSFWK